MNPWIWGWLNYVLFIAAIITTARIAGQNGKLRAQLEHAMKLVVEQQEVLRQQRELLQFGATPAPRAVVEDDGRRDV